MAYYTTVHAGWGSMVEGAYPVGIMGPFDTAPEADNAGTRFFRDLSTHPTLGYLARDVWTQTIRTPDTPVGVKEALDAFTARYGE